MFVPINEDYIYISTGNQNYKRIVTVKFVVIIIKHRQYLNYEFNSVRQLKNGQFNGFPFINHRKPVVD